MFSLTDGMALEVFVVEGWPGDEVSSPILLFPWVVLYYSCSS